MSDNWIGEIRLFPYSKVPNDWHVCDGSILQVLDYKALFSLIYNSYGGDGVTTFALPDLRGRVPLHRNPSDTSCAIVGKAGGLDSVTLTTDQLPPHIHSMYAVSQTPPTGSSPLNGYPASVAASPIAQAPPPPAIYGPAGPLVALDPGSLQTTGGGAAHENRQPTMALQWCICVVGYYPMRS